MKYYYAREYTYGKCVNGGCQPDTIARFTESEARSAWVRSGASDKKSRGYREALTGSEVALSAYREWYIEDGIEKQSY